MDSTPGNQICISSPATASSCSGTRGMQREGPLLLAPDLKETLAQVDQFEIDTRKMVDQHIVCSGLTSPPETVPQLRDGYEQDLSRHWSFFQYIPFISAPFCCTCSGGRPALAGEYSTG